MEEKPQLRRGEVPPRSAGANVPPDSHGTVGGGQIGFTAVMTRD